MRKIMNKSFRNKVFELFSVDFEAGVFIRKKSSGGRLAGEVAGSLRPDGYINLSIDNRSYLAHRVIYFLHTGENPKQVDHINGDKSDNRVSNLRAACPLINSRNTKLSVANKTGFVGVRYRKTRDAYEAYWDEGLGKKKYKYFSCAIYGHKKAREMAVNHRAKAIYELNKLGYGYTERHGTL